MWCAILVGMTINTIRSVVISSLLLVGLLASSRAGATEVDVCEAYRSVLTAERGDSEETALEDGDALDARDDCRAASWVFRNAPLSDMVGDYDLIVDPWAR
jgi:hypothetical protein